MHFKGETELMEESIFPFVIFPALEKMGAMRVKVSPEDGDMFTIWTENKLSKAQWQIMNVKDISNHGPNGFPIVAVLW